MREAVIVSSVRTPGGRAKRGGLKDTRADVLARTAVKACLANVPAVKPEMIDDVVFGCSFPEAEQGLNIGRVIAKHCGLPDEVPGFVVNRFCSSGLQAIALAAQNIMCGWNDVVLAGGVESMSRVPMGGFINRPDPEWTDTYPDIYMSMGSTAENVAKRYNISREQQDELGVRSNALAAEAQDKGWFKDELTPVTEAVRYAIKDGKRIKDHYTFDADDGVRRGTTVEGLAKLRPAFWKNGTVTAGNSSQTTDAAAASLLMSREKANELGLKPLAKFINFQVAGCRSDEMGVGPSYAIPKLLKKVGLETKDIDYFEINEAFASQTIYCVRELGMMDRLEKGDINCCGGAIALGHPLGCTGAKLTATLIHQMRRRGVKRGIVSMCIGGGMGAAGLIELEE
ncbi:MAG TPA: thiolase family protein [bacterium]|nr:thiolase family protein [bacterium]